MKHLMLGAALVLAVPSPGAAQEAVRVLVLGDAGPDIVDALRMELAPLGLRAETDEGQPEDAAALIRDHGARAVVYWVGPPTRVHVVLANGSVSAAALDRGVDPRTQALVVASLLEDAQDLDPLSIPSTGVPVSRGRIALSRSRRSPSRSMPLPAEHRSGRNLLGEPRGRGPITFSPYFDVSLGGAAGTQGGGGTARASIGLTFSPGVRLGVGASYALIEERLASTPNPLAPGVLDDESFLSSLATTHLLLGYVATWGPVAFQVGGGAGVGYSEKLGHGDSAGIGMMHLGMGFLADPSVVVFARYELVIAVPIHRAGGPASLMGAALGMEIR